MACGALLFKGKIPFVVELEGDVNGEVFSVRGNGWGDGSTGKLEIKFVCTTGEVPLAWESLICSMAYGALVFCKYPSNINDFFKSTMPRGYIQERKISYENDGTFDVRQEVTYENGALYNRVKFNGSGFRKDGNVLGKKLDLTSIGTCIYIMGNDEGTGLKGVFNKAFKVIGGNRQIASHVQTQTPIGDGLVSIPDYHVMHNHIACSKDPSETRDHIIVKESLRAVDCNTEYM
uniref:Non-fluorescent chromoprotein FP2 n=1 Tax=Aequorea australis TaxID=1246302 RepID=A0A5J6CYI7_9CNID|nr:non-fluorescent chromoprotein FP2 [Aequorea australis]